MSLPLLSDIKDPIFSKLWSSRNHDRSAMDSPHLALAFSTKLFKNLQRADFPLPVGIQIPIHRITGSTHSVASTFTDECDMQKLTVKSRPDRTATGGMLMAFPIWWQP